MFTQKVAVTCLLIACLSACNTLKPTDDPSLQISADPLQSFNRRIHNFNNNADKAILKPVAKGYTRVAPKRVRKSVSNFFQNLSEPLYGVNNLLQGKVDRTLISAYRFIVNSTAGVGGLFDVVDHFYNIKPSKEDFGQTLAAWGVNPGPYLVLPFIGPSNLRDGFGFVVDRVSYFPNNIITNENVVTSGLSVLNIVNTRAGFLRFDPTLRNQIDTYQFIKAASEKSRLNDIYDGNPPVLVKEDFDDF